MSNEIPELGGTGKLKCTEKTYDDDKDDSSDETEKITANSFFKNSPVMAWYYTDHERNTDIVLVAVPIISGSRDISFTIAENGMSVTINYLWPISIFNAVELFNDEINDHNVTINHPKIHSLTSALLKAGITANSSPKGQIIVDLPLRVQREVGSWTKNAKTKRDGTKVIVLQFLGFQEKIIIKEADTRINFD